MKRRLLNLLTALSLLLCVAVCVLWVRSQFVPLWRRGRALAWPNRLQFGSLRDPAESADGILGPPTPLPRPAVMGLPV